ncbi:hypothetical protein BOTBODRAFT_421852 [Botryobasidium botryosum FD-172 SS1]|uniref:Uncharacterized protein n=1 Tax=Botryobasidium botryosum (strain FD-172 SS1) TaxID=930990 RepID=A0A067M9C6_BOTB1|nr:hypothetical protein BOTBODRAFT_421852 [Botryobasidium botryosum FD-172 SS1]
MPFLSFFHGNKTKTPYIGFTSLFSTIFLPSALSLAPFLACRSSARLFSCAMHSRFFVSYYTGSTDSRLDCLITDQNALFPSRSFILYA